MCVVRRGCEEGREKMARSDCFFFNLFVFPVVANRCGCSSNMYKPHSRDTVSYTHLDVYKRQPRTQTNT